MRNPLVLAAILLQGCGGGGSDATRAAEPAEATALPERAIAVREDERHTGTLAFPAATSGATYRVATRPRHGDLEVAADGTFDYAPVADFHGRDSFSYEIEDPAGPRFSGAVEIDVLPVNDPPELTLIADQANSPETAEALVGLGITDVDGDPVTIEAASDDPRVASVEVEPGTRLLRVRGRDYGTTRISVRVADGEAEATRDFAFTVADRQRLLTVRAQQPASTAIALANNSAEGVEIELTHNGKHAFASLEQVVAAVRAQPDETAGEPFERKLWRFLRDNTLRYPPVGGASWLDGTWPTLNSFGWGFCSNVTSAYIEIAAAAGYEARAWTLAGHVLPEIRIDGAWQAYDPDVAVYYHRRDGAIASVTDLALDTTLITAPEDPLFDPGSAGYVSAYDPLLAQIYGTRDDNVLATWYPSREAFPGSRISLPAGARLVYPGRWTPDPVGYDGSTPYPVEFSRQARLELPAGVSGRIRVPFVLWDVQGTGTVQVGGTIYPAGSAGLAARLATADAPVTEVDILGNTAGVALVMMINPLWFEVLPTNEIIVTGKDTWAIEQTLVPLDGENRVDAVPDRVRRPAA